MSQERVLKTLMRLGLSETDAQVYVYLATSGPQIARNITSELKMYKRKTYRSLKSLQNKEIVKADLEQPAHFSAMPFGKALDLLIKAHLKEASYIELNKAEILAHWQSLVSARLYREGTRSKHLKTSKGSEISFIVMFVL